MVPTRQRVVRALLIPVVVLAVGLGAASCGGGLEDGGGDQADELLQAALTAHANGDLEAAEQGYLKVIQADPQNKFAYYNLGVISQGRGDPNGAEASYRTTLGIDPDFAPALFNLAILLTELDRDKEAVDLYEHVIDVEPTNASAHLNLGFLLIDKGRESRGQRELDEAVRLDPTLADRIGPQEPGEEPVSDEG